MEREEQDSQFAFLTSDFEELLLSLEVKKNKEYVMKNHDYEKEVSSFDKLLDRQISKINLKNQDIYGTYSRKKIHTFPEEAGLAICRSSTGQYDPLLSGVDKTLNDKNGNVTEVSQNNTTYSNISSAPSVRQLSISSEPLGHSFVADADAATTYSPFHPNLIAGYIDGASECVTKQLAPCSMSPSPLSLSPSPLTRKCQSSEEVMGGRSNSAPLTQSRKKYFCHICEKRFKRPSSLSTHMNIHTGQRPYLCPLGSCAKPFNARSNMLRHYKIHFKIGSGEYLLPNGEVTSAKPTSRQLLSDSESHSNYRSNSNFERHSL